MKNRQTSIQYLCLIILAILPLACSSNSSRPEKAAKTQKTDAYKSADIGRGGLLYDKWFKIVKADLKGSHPRYPAEGKKSGANTWRCKECHGWDYIGKDGRYKQGSHFTGIEGLWKKKDKSAKDLFAAMKNAKDKHDFSKYMSDTDLWALTKFIREGLIDIKQVIGKDTISLGDAVKGKPLFDANCTKCHGADGLKLDFDKKAESVQGISWLANKNPQETMHKIRWGHPGTTMPSLVVDTKLSLEQMTDILSYCQTLKK